MYQGLYLVRKEEVLNRHVINFFRFVICVRARFEVVNYKRDERQTNTLSATNSCEQFLR